MVLVESASVAAVPSCEVPRPQDVLSFGPSVFHPSARTGGTDVRGPCSINDPFATDWLIRAAVGTC